MAPFRFVRIFEELSLLGWFMEALLYANGVCLDMGKPIEATKNSKRKKGKKGGGKRKKLTGKYSAASFRRMREYCITHDCDGDCWGITLTVPGLTVVSVDDFKKIVHKVGVFCNHWDTPIIWRCELQQRGQPHLHIVLYGTVKDCVYLLRQWFKLITKLGVISNVESCGDCNEIVTINRAFCNGSIHMFDVQKLHGDFRSWRYLVAHASKAKQAQLGWAGRQWGVVCRPSFKALDFKAIELEDREMFCLRRWVRRASFRRIGKYGKHFVLLNPYDLQRMIDYLRDDYFGAPF